jgi:hypothetical protein
MGNSQASISNLNNLQKWLRNFFLPSLSFLLPESLRGDAQVTLIHLRTGFSLRNVRSKSISLTRLLLHLATEKVAMTTTKVKVFIQTRITGRFIVGMFLVGCFAPLADIFYAFDFLKQYESWHYDTEHPTWYWDNYCDLFLCLGPYMAWILIGFGVNCLCMPATSKKKYLLVVSIFYPVTKIIWLITVTSDPEFHQIPEFAYWIYGVMSSIILWCVAEYLLYFFNHKVLNCLSTLSNITNNRDKLPAEQAVEMYATTCEKLKSII